MNNCVPTKSFILEARKLPNLSSAGVPKKISNGQYQLYFEFVNKILLPSLRKGL